ncbi:MAG TPA: hypothetical protein VK029_02765 [Pseudogracilibacillus sp.]|nr:hypothetical protein [Pseudogracilibacillus sp.]
MGKGKDFKKDKQVGGIIEVSDKGTNFNNGMASKLPVVSKIFATKEESIIFLLMESEGKTLAQYVLVEG